MFGEPFAVTNAEREFIHAHDEEQRAFERYGLASDEYRTAADRKRWAYFKYLGAKAEAK